MQQHRPKIKAGGASRTPGVSPVPAIFSPSSGLACAAIVFAAFLAYANSIGGEFVFDDTVIIQGNKIIQGLDGAHLKEIFGGHYWKAVERQGGLYRPVVMLTYAVNYAVDGEDPTGYHLFNVVVHALNGILLFFLIEELVSRRPLSFLSALLFILHPIRTEGVASIVGRAESLSAFFILAGWWAYVRQRKEGGPRWLALSLASFLLAVLCKESAFSFIALLPLADFLLGGGKMGGLRPALLRYLPYAAILAFTLALRVKILGGVMPLYINPSSNPLVNADGWSRFLTATWVFGRYLWLLIFPLQLSADYSFNEIELVSGLLSWRALVSLSVLVLLLLGTLISARRAPFLFFCGFVFFSSFVLTSNWLRPIGTIMAERLLYFPSLGFTCAVAFLLCEGFVRARWRTLARAGAPVLILGYAVRTLDRNFDWKDHYALFGSAVRASPNSSLAQANYASILLNMKNDARGAIEHALKAVKILPEDPAAYFTLGEAYMRTGELERAAGAFQAVAKLAPRTSGGVSALRRLANIREGQGETSAAISDNEKILEWRPADIASYLALARLYGKVGRWDRVKENLDKARQLAPRDPAVIQAWQKFENR
jgi:tetratricopeptide (TPR) repeat protein